YTCRLVRSHSTLHSFPTRRSSDLEHDGLGSVGRQAFDQPGVQRPVPWRRKGLLQLVMGYFVQINQCHIIRQNVATQREGQVVTRSEEHTSELQSRVDLVCRLLLEK